MNEKMTGYLMLIAGVLIMLGALTQVFLVFTGKVEPLSVFQIKAPSLSLSDFLPTLPSGSQINLGSTQSQKIEFIPTQAFNKMINMSLTIFLMGFVLSFGYKIASLGIMLIRPIVVKEAKTP